MNSHATILHDPTSELVPILRPRVMPRGPLLEMTIALFDLGKIRSDEFLGHLEQLLTQRGHKVVRVAKPTNAKPASLDVLQEIVESADVVVEALAD